MSTKLLYFLLGLGLGLCSWWVTDRVLAYRFNAHYENQMARYDTQGFLDEEPQLDVEKLLDLALTDARTGTSTTIRAASDKVLFVNLWATWCNPCILEMPSIARLKELRGDSTAFFLISNEEPDRVREFATNDDSPLPFYHYDLDGSGLETIAGQAIPRTFIIYNARVILDHVGSAPWDSEKVLAIIDGLLASEPEKQ
ncbi:MAG: TlpA disulfide reductase family protein [Planctomycetota bacterium]|nr:TlpA disulfide reductase family protein [Planctomycetota bacterium]